MQNFLSSMSFGFLLCRCVRYVSDYLDLFSIGAACSNNVKKNKSFKYKKIAFIKLKMTDLFVSAI